MGPNFTACSALFKNNLALYANYTYHGPVEGIQLPGSHLLTTEGCYDLCGSGNSYYSWQQASGTILTWAMPILALVVKAPFGANSPPKRTMINLFRWVGSPVTSLAYIFWNIKISGKCALMVDMASSYDEVPGPDSAFADIRDSLYILSVMNQYQIRTRLPSIEAEKLLRVALFSDTLKLGTDADSETLPQKRRTLAYRLRAGRRQGLVPIFLSTVWWVFGLAVSLENAFGNLGANATAHNLAIGLMMAWFPVLILSSIVDRTPWATEEIRVRMNALLESVRAALQNPELRENYMKVEGRTLHDFEWVKALAPDSFLGQTGFFTGFAGQGRVRWHYGVANPVLTGIEEAYVAQKGRAWLGTSDEEVWYSRTSMVLGPDHGDHLEGLRYFDLREFWEVICAVATVGGAIFGAFLISYFTPTAGYGCRSGGYTIFFIISCVEALFEGLAWWYLWDPIPAWANEHSSKSEATDGDSDKNSNGYFARWAQRWHRDPRRIIELFILRPMEFTNTAWLVYIIAAQTFGIYNNCYCKSSSWGGRGGYVTFESSDVLKSDGVVRYWAAGTALSLFVVVVGLAYVVAEWLTQSHLNTTNYDAAARGLRRTRTFKKYTLWIRVPVDLFLKGTRVVWEAARGASKGNRGRRSLVWSGRSSQTEEIQGVESARSAGSPMMRLGFEGEQVSENNAENYHSENKPSAFIVTRGIRDGSTRTQSSREHSPAHDYVDQKTQQPNPSYRQDSTAKQPEPVTRLDSSSSADGEDETSMNVTSVHYQVTQHD